jgi:hypothetical protein
VNRTVSVALSKAQNIANARNRFVYECRCCTLRHTQLTRTSGNANRKKPGEKQENRNKKRRKHQRKHGRITDQQANLDRRITKKKTTNAITTIPHNSYQYLTFYHLNNLTHTSPKIPTQFYNTRNPNYYNIKSMTQNRDSN